MYVTDLPLVLPYNLPEYVHEALEGLEKVIEIRAGLVPGFHKEQLAIYERVQNKHCMFDRDKLTLEGFEAALYNLGWGPAMRKLHANPQ